MDRSAEPSPSPPVPTITVPLFALGLMAMSILSGIIVALFLCVIPTILFVAVGIRHPSLFKIHAVFEFLLAIGVSIGLNVILVGSWCFNGLFYSTNRRILVVGLLLLWYAFLLRFSVATPFFELGLALVVLMRAIWLKVTASAQPY
jgi:hypothetical protein